MMSIREAFGLGDGKPYTGFRCRTCGSTKLIETMKDVVVTSECSINEAGVTYHDQTNEDGEVVGYQCELGHNVMVGPEGAQQVVTDAEELVQLFCDNPILSHDDVIELVADRLRGLSGWELVEEHNREFDSNIKYLGDGLYSLKEVEE